MKKCDRKSKIRSKGKGRGLGTGKGKGPLGVPVKLVSNEEKAAAKNLGKNSKKNGIRFWFW